ncbi:hypothetical protein CDAR_546771 [Caerostris darwini]|uniref:Ycf15 n=1 Tax=Caerostris darwini TaxID=1538125 RepID=A0AAV4WW28_9ARAC|nr:hypothetical protein CDAR_546771 [Caerostris darwini]
MLLRKISDIENNSKNLVFDSCPLFMGSEDVEGKEREENGIFPFLYFSWFSKIFPWAFTLHGEMFDPSRNNAKDLEEGNIIMRKTDCSESFFASVDIQAKQ